MFGSLMMFASGVCGELAELGERVGDPLVARRRRSGNWARIRPASEMSRSSISTPAAAANARTIGSSDCVASAGASSVMRVDDLHRRRTLPAALPAARRAPVCSRLATARPRRAGSPRRGRGASPSSRSRSASSRAASASTRRDVVGLVDRAPLARVVAAFEAAPQLAPASALDRLVHPQDELVAARGDDRVVQREVPDLELLGAAPRSRRRSRQRRISSKSRLVAQATTSGSTWGSIRRRAAITSAGPTSSARPPRAARRASAAARARARNVPRPTSRETRPSASSDRERVAHHRPRHAEIGGERALGRQPTARRASRVRARRRGSRPRARCRTARAAGALRSWSSPSVTCQPILPICSTEQPSAQRAASAPRLRA